MEKYWNECPQTNLLHASSSTTSNTPVPKKLKKSKASHLAEYNHLHQESVKRTKEAQGWQAELQWYRRYLDEADVNKDTDLVKLWQVRYPSLPLTISLTYELSTSFLKEIGSGFPTI